MTNQNRQPNSLSLSLSRKRKLALRKTLLLTTLALALTAIIAPPLVSSVQNIFIGFNKITEIWYNGEPIQKVVYQGQIIWEREPPNTPPEPDPTNPTTYGPMQTLTNSECSTTRGTAFDARNGQTYYVQKIGNLCWMETNLRYAGNGTWASTWGYPDDRYATTTSNTTANPNDNTRPLSTTTSGFLGGTQTTAYQQAGYFDPAGSTNYTNTTANGGFYGYLYNWCSAMGGQANACNNTTGTPQSNFDTTKSICPAGWRLPTGNTGGELQTLNTAVNGGAAGTDVGLRNNFLAVYPGSYSNALNSRGNGGAFWSSTVRNATNAYYLYFSATSVRPADNYGKYYGFTVRCVM